MSVINTMLQDLDRRQGGVPGGAEAPPSYVRAVKAPAERRPFFWATIGLLIAIAVGWVGYVGYQLSPRKLATDLAFKTVDEARTRQAVASAPVAVAQPPAPIAAAPAPTPP